MTQGFVHLHLHTEYSIVDSVIRVEPLIDQVAALGMPAVAMTDQSNLFAMVKFYRAALKKGIKPIIGADLWLRYQDDERAPGHLILLCKNDEGYRNLSRLLTRAFLDGQESGLPVLRREWLTPDIVSGLLSLSAGRDGSLGRTLLGSRAETAVEVVEDFRELFGGDFFIELQRTGRPREEEYLDRALRLASGTACPIVATNDVRFLRAGDFEAHEARVCIQQGRTLSDADRPRVYSPQQFLRSPAEMEELFADLPEALENSVEIARRCSLTLALGETHLPDYELPASLTADDYLTRQARQGLEARMSASASGAAEIPTEYRARLDQELAVIHRMGFPGYFLIVADFIRWAKDNDIPVGPGRGSGAGSLVAYALGITDLDPIEHDLLFERFLNSERVSMPDFDVDFCMEGRDRVIDYVAERYGRDHVSQIITYGTMAARAVVRDVGRVLGYPYGVVDRIAKLIPMELGMTLDKALSPDSEFKDLYQSDDDVRAIVDLARQLEGLVRNAGKHAGGVVIAPSDITDFAPLYRVEGERATVTQFDKDDVEAAGLVKFDFLGLRTLTIIDRAIKNINADRVQQGQPAIDIRSIPMNDEKAFALLCACRTTAVFQLESRGMRDLVKRLQPDRFDEIVALVALFRPGPLQSGMVEDFIARKHGGPGQTIDYLHPDLEPVLAGTYGVILYQEQVMQIAQRLAGYSLGEADLLRRAMGKKKPDEMAKQRSVFVDGAAARGVERHQASHIFDLMEKFAGYGFNKSHSAAYALLSYQTAWLKANYAAAFMAAALSSDMDDTDKLQVLKRECAEMALNVLPPDVNDSSYMFEVRGASTIRYGLGAVKGLGKSAAEQILLARATTPFADLDDFCQRVGAARIGRRALEALIKSGALDGLGPNRPSLLAALPVAIGRAEQVARSLDSGQEELFSAGEAEPQRREAVAPLRDWSFAERLAAERESLGLYLSGHPFDQYRMDEPHIVSGTIAGLTTGRVRNGGDSRPVGAEVSAAGLVTGLRRRGNRVTFDLDDGEARLEVSLFRELFEKYRHLLANHAIVVVSGSLRFDDFIDGWRLRGREVMDIDRVIESQATSLVIRWQQGVDQPIDAKGLQALLEPFRPGSCGVSLFVRRRGVEARLSLGDTWAVRPSRELRERLSELVGIDGFRFVYESPGP